MVPLRQRLYNLYRDVEVSRHELLYLFLEITRRCNLSCRHCGSDCGKEPAGPTLTAESWSSIVDYVSARFSPSLLLVITGGEPLTCPFLAELGHRITRNGRRWGMVTNGYALDDLTLRGLRDAGLASITISLDGDRQSHGYLRNDARAYDRALEAIDRVMESDIPWKDVVTCVFPGNLDRLSETAATLLAHRVRRWRLFRIFPRGRARGSPDLLLNEKQTRRLIGWIAAERPRLRRSGLTVDYSCEGWLPFALDRKVRTEPFFCRAGVNIASILCDGTITGCANNGSGFHVGNLLTDDFAALWEKGFDRFRDRSWMRRGACAGCRHFAGCRGGSIHLWDDAGLAPAGCADAIS